MEMFHDYEEDAIEEDIIFSSSASTSSSSPEDGDESISTDRIDIIYNISNYTAREFRSHFRLRRSTVNFLIEQYQQFQLTETAYTTGRPSISAAKQIYMFLWYMANTVTFRQLGFLFKTSKSIAWKYVNKICIFIINISKDYIKWPEVDELDGIAQRFENIKGIPKVVGAIDGTHIAIKCPIENSVDYYNRKKYYSVAMQLVVDSKKRILDVYCGEPGSVHDARMLRKSGLYQKIEGSENCIPQQFFILGDSAYPNRRWLVTPFKDYGNLNEVQRRFNTLHSSTRVVVENTIGLLKTRFRRLLHFTEQMHIPFVVNIIYSACVLHNICLSQDDTFQEEDEEISTGRERNEPYAEYEEEFLDRREELLQQLQRANIL